MQIRAKLEEIALAALRLGCLLMEAGASARPVEDHTTLMARGLGADRVDIRMGYASIAITVGIGEDIITRMHKVGPLGVNQRLDHGLRVLAEQVGEGRFNARQALAELQRLVHQTPRHPAWLMAIAVGVACAAFGRLLGVDWPGEAPILLGSAMGQYMRALCAQRRVNVFIAAAAVAFLASVVAGVGARWLGSSTVDVAMVSSVLLLIPGVPVLNAQNDILEGRPTLGSARAVWVIVLLVFLTVGVWFGRALFGGDTVSANLTHLLHQTVFGGLAAAGFGVLFNIGFRALPWCFGSGALALAVRTLGLNEGWSLEGACFAAALAVGSAVQLLQARTGISRNALGVAGCIPMVPGSFATKAVLGLFALTGPSPHAAGATLLLTVENGLRVIFTIGAIGTGLAVPTLLLQVRGVRELFTIDTSD